MTGHVGVVTDSACDLPDDIVSRLGIQIVPLSIRFGDDEFVDREELSTAEFWARCKASPTLPSTAAPSPGRFEQAYRQLADDGARHIVVITLSGALSATLQSAELAAKSVAAEGIEVTAVDSRTVSLGTGTIALACAQLAATLPADAESLATIVSTATELVGRTRVFGALDTMDNLKKGGRVGNAKALRFLVDKVAAASQAMEHLAVLHADCDDVDEFVAQLRPYYPGEIVVGQIGPVVGAHAGLGTIGVAYQETTAQIHPSPS